MEEITIIRGKKILIIFGLILLFTPLAVSQTGKEAYKEIQEVEEAINEMNQTGLPTKRASDLLKEANISYKSQVAVNQTGGDPDFSRVMETTEKIRNIKREAYRVEDEIKALEERIQDLESTNLDLKEVKNTFNQAKEEFASERFEQAKEKIDQTYEEISSAQAVSTRVRAIYEASRENVVSFVRNNWRTLLIVLVSFPASFWIAYREVYFYLLKKRKKRLKMRKGVIKDLIKESQYKYFEKGDMPEATYNVRTSKYGEMIRDLNRRIPLINEELMKRNSFFQSSS